MQVSGTSALKTIPQGCLERPVEDGASTIWPWPPVGAHHGALLMSFPSQIVLFSRMGAVRYARESRRVQEYAAFGGAGLPSEVFPPLSFPVPDWQ